MTLSYAHLSSMYLRTAVESLNGLTPDAAPLDQRAHKVSQNKKHTSGQEVPPHKALNIQDRARSSVG